MIRIDVADKRFEISITSSEIQRAVCRIAEELNRDLVGKEPLFISILNGSFLFAADLIRKIDQPCQISFVKLKSYEADKSTGQVTELIGLDETITNKTIVILEDIIDSGLTINKVVKQLEKMKPKEIIVATLLFKPNACKTELKPNYAGIEIPNDFIVGYGLDYKGFGRNLNDIYTVIN